MKPIENEIIFTHDNDTYQQSTESQEHGEKQQFENTLQQSNKNLQAYINDMFKSIFGEKTEMIKSTNKKDNDCDEWGTCDEDYIEPLELSEEDEWFEDDVRERNNDLAAFNKYGY